MSGSEADLSAIPEDVREVGRFAYRIATELRSGANSLDSEVAALMTSWTGGAADSYRAGWDEMNAGAVRVWDELFELAEKLGITADTYQQRDQSAAGTFGSLDL